MIELKWISVKDRLPERKGLDDDETEYVLVAVPWGTDNSYNVTVCGYEKNGWSRWDNFGMSCDDHERVAYWMPLPEQPEEEMDDVHMDEG